MTRPLLTIVIVTQLEILLLFIAVIVLAARVDAASRSAATDIPATANGPSMAAAERESEPSPLAWALPSPSGLVRPSPSAAQSPVASKPAPASRSSMKGTATWYRWHPGEAAAGPPLRHGNWRGRLVTVCGRVCLRVRLTDWCACAGRLIDLDYRSFSRLAPLSQGLVPVSVTR